MTHTGDADGACTETCPDPVHDGPVLLALEPRELELVRDVLSDVGVNVVHVPTTPTTLDGHRCYAAPPAPPAPARGPRLKERTRR